jgi:hypothetical protein
MLALLAGCQEPADRDAAHASDTTVVSQPVDSMRGEGAWRVSLHEKMES